jgi:heme exporter protein B
MRSFLVVMRRDVALALRQGGAGTMAVTFFVMAVTLFPFGVGPDIEILRRISSGVIWVAALLACLLSLDRLFQADFEDGSLDLMALSPLPLWGLVLAKCAAHWITTALPLIVVAPVLALLLNMPASGFGALVAAMVIGTPALSLIGAIGASLTVAMRRGGVLLSLLVLPLYVPVIIFGAGAVDAVVGGYSAAPYLMILGALTLFTVVLSPVASAGALKLALA